VSQGVFLEAWRFFFGRDLFDYCRLRTATVSVYLSVVNDIMRYMYQCKRRRSKKPERKMKVTIACRSDPVGAVLNNLSHRVT